MYDGGGKIMKDGFSSACLFSVVILLALAQVCSAKENQLGNITSCSGDVQIKRQKEEVWGKGELNTPVNFGDTIRTGQNSQGTITYLDSSLLTIYSDSRITLNTFVSPLENKNSVLLFFGRVWSKVGRKAFRRKAFEVQTPTAVCGVRATEFVTAAYEDGTMMVRVDSGKVGVDNEANQTTLSSNEGTQLSFDTKEIKTEPDFRPEWERARREARNNLFADGRKYGSFVDSEIHRRRDHLKHLVDEAGELSRKRQGYLSLATNAKRIDDEIEYEASMSDANRMNEEIKQLNTKIAFYGRRLECHFGLFFQYGSLAKHPELSKKFQGKEFILKQLDNIEMIHAEFNAMIEEGMKMSMEDMEDLMDEMRNEVKEFKRRKGISE
jgi:hypothetical protein